MAQIIEPWQLEQQNNPVGVELVEESKIDTVCYQPKLQTLGDIACIIAELKDEKDLRIRKQNTEIRFGAEYTIDERAKYDFMVTTNCPGCGDRCCIRIDRPICYFCVNSYELERSVQ